MNFRQLHTFVLIAEAGGFAAAEESLHLSQPAASRQIQALEAELGILLFDRIGRRVKLTAEGENLLRRGRHLLREAESFVELARALKGGEAGTLRVAGSPQHIEMVLADFLPGYRKRHPLVDVDLIEEGGARVPERLERGDAHLALMVVGREPYQWRVLAPVYLLAVVSTKHRFAGRQMLEFTELVDERLLLLRRDFGSRAWFDAACGIAHMRPRIVLESAAPHTLLALVKSGNDVAIVPSNVQISRESARALPLLHRRAPIGQWAVVAWDPQRFLSEYAKQFIDELVVFCRRNYPGRELIKRAPPLPKPRETNN
jgi:DNA-binding transcriptional LysR family regulator